MSIEQIVQVWKSSEKGDRDIDVPENPVGEELAEEELREVTGGRDCTYTCFITCYGALTSF